MSGPQSHGRDTNKRSGIVAPGNKFENWYRRNVKKDLAPVIYHDGVDAAIDGAGLP